SAAIPHGLEARTSSVVRPHRTAAPGRQGCRRGEIRFSSWYQGCAWEWSFFFDHTSVGHVRADKDAALGSRIVDLGKSEIARIGAEHLQKRIGSGQCA